MNTPARKALDDNMESSTAIQSHYCPETGTTTQGLCRICAVVPDNCECRHVSKYFLTIYFHYTMPSNSYFCWLLECISEGGA
mmetsp:Transcript_42791/g.76961  ORF Transcript_42791/g.76961 Transcript_42791/m.76961 type:complete len:82 (+) Transcript_42791:269-514(+)